MEKTSKWTLGPRLIEWYILWCNVLTFQILSLQGGIDNDELGEELGPGDGEGLDGAVAKRLGNLEMGDNVTPIDHDIEVDASGYVMA
jgi:hypothetical protein